MAQQSKWQSVCRWIDVGASVSLLLFVNSLFSFVSGMAIYRIALQGPAKGWIANLFLSGILFGTICFAGSVIKAFIQWLRPDSSDSPKLGIGKGLLWGSAIAIPSALAGTVTPPSQELFLAGLVFVAFLIPVLFAVMFMSRVLAGIRE